MLLDPLFKRYVSGFGVDSRKQLFLEILELLREGLIEIVQSEAYGPLHVRLGNPARHLKLVADDDAGTAAAANDDLARNQ